jgi:hypothetical protein
MMSSINDVAKLYDEFEEAFALGVSIPALRQR